MPKYLAGPGGVAQGELTVPGDKSISHRSLMLGGIAEGVTDITGFLAGEDCLSTLRALQAMGVRIERPEEQHVIVHGVGPHGLKAAAGPLDMGNAGTAMRLSMGLLAPQSFNSTLIGDESLMSRPMERAAVPLRLMGANITTQNGRPPVEIRGSKLKGIDYTLPVASAQVKSAVILAGLQAAGVTRVTEPAPTRDHTERMLRAFGVKISTDGPVVTIEGGQTLKGTNIQVPADFSSAAFFMVAGCLAASEKPLLLRNVGVNPTRTGLLQLLIQMGADIKVHARGDAAEPIADIEIRKSRLKGITVSEDLVPLSIDEFPVFFVAAACAEGETLVRGAEELRVKETDRLAAMAEGLTTLGVENELQPDGLWIRGGDGFKGGTVNSHGDHRIAMSFAIASLRAKGEIEILDVANVATSFPGFIELSRSVGLHIQTA
jgi:cyclohexadieny/prephenate dehydrogenase / 3-phosphoshikimate 1-carboxyvinyltransferase